jgi:transcriptional regulator with XRE-family HTH domain
MSNGTNILRRSHFLGVKIKHLRKQHRLTLEDLSVRCIQLDVDSAPSVSYLSMIENGKRVPSQELLKVVAEIFQKPINWFFDENFEDETPVAAGTGGPPEGMPLEPGFLFSNTLLKTALPELLEQTGTTGRQFAHLLIRARQEVNQNNFPDLERAAESVGHKRFPLNAEDLLDIASDLNLAVEWFDKKPFRDPQDASSGLRTVLRSFYEPPGTIYLNKKLERFPERLKYDIANHIAHKVLHGGDGARAPQTTGGSMIGLRRDEANSPTLDSKDILYAWRDFECSYFAAALLCPKTPFRRFLAKHAYALDCAQAIGVSTTLLMRRMSSVSPYPHWHYFDAYPPGHLRAVYRGNGIPLPWGNMKALSDPCQHWAVFRMFANDSNQPSAQVSVLKGAGQSRLYCCESARRKDLAGNLHVLCAGVDLAPALATLGVAVDDTIAEIEAACNRDGGSAAIPNGARKHLVSVSKILNIGWIADGAAKAARIICQRSTFCPRESHCLGPSAALRNSNLEDLKATILLDKRR